MPPAVTPHRTRPLRGEGGALNEKAKPRSPPAPLPAPTHPTLQGPGSGEITPAKGGYCGEGGQRDKKTESFCLPEPQSGAGTPGPLRPAAGGTLPDSGDPPGPLLQHPSLPPPPPPLHEYVKRVYCGRAGRVAAKPPPNAFGCGAASPLPPGVCVPPPSFPPRPLRLAAPPPPIAPMAGAPACGLRVREGRCVCVCVSPQRGETALLLLLFPPPAPSCAVNYNNPEY